MAGAEGRGNKLSIGKSIGEREIGVEECEEEEEEKRGGKNQYLRGEIKGGESEGVGTRNVECVEKGIKNTLWGKRG